jgi:hypothetical protein
MDGLTIDWSGSASTNSLKTFLCKQILADVSDEVN